jgi:hypothetical protein
MRLPQAQAIVRETMFLKGTATFGLVGVEERCVKLREYLLLPRLLFLAARAPRDQRLAWDRYWSEVARTGFDGEVLWDAGDQTEFREYAHADPDLPLV